MNFKTYLEVLISLPKTVFFNFRYLPFNEAKKLPILVHYKTKIVKCTKGAIVIENTPKLFMIKLGFNENIMASSRRNSLIWIDGGKLIFQGKATIGKGTNIRTEGQLVVGNNFYAQQNSTLWCSNEIVLGDDILFGWNVMVRDHDGHTLFINGTEKPENKPIHIGNHVWLCSEVDIMKGVVIKEDSVVGYRSLVTAKFNESNLLIVGTPARAIQSNINWKR